MFEILGVVFCVILLVGLSLVWFSMSAISGVFGKYSIGGVPTEISDIIISLITLIILGYLWYLLFVHLPFSISISIKIN